MTLPRQVVPGRDLLCTRRVTQRCYLLRPDPEVEQIYCYCLAEAAARFKITLYGWIAMGNHEHLLLRDNLGNVPEFLAHFHKMVAKALNRFRGRHENLWSSEQPNIVHLVELDDVLAKLTYLLANPVAGHLVDRATDWPGASSLRQNLSGRTVTIKRPRGYFRDNGPMPDVVTLRAERLEGYGHLTQQEWHDKIAEAVRLEEEEARRERAAKRIGVLGRKAVLQVNPTDQPSTIAPRGRLRPHLACRNPERRAHELGALRGFRAAYRSARQRWCTGNRDALFPIGTYGMLRFGVRCATADPPALTPPLS
jgi:putative transposase